MASEASLDADLAHALPVDREIVPVGIFGVGQEGGLNIRYCQNRKGSGLNIRY